MSDLSTIPTKSILTDASSIAAFNRGPITAAFSQPSSCVATFTLNPDNLSELYVGHFGNSYVDLECYPSPTIVAQNLVTPSSWDIYYYSPAICPQSWTVVTTFKSTIHGWNTLMFLSVGSDTSAALCCPSGYSYSGYGHMCASKITQNQVISYVLPTNSGNNIFRGLVSKSTVAKESNINGDGVQIWWQSSDDAVFASASTILTQTTAPATTTMTASAQTGATTSIAMPTSTSTSALGEDGSGGLSIGAKAGIGAGIPIAVFVGLAMGYFFFRRQRKNSMIQGGAMQEAHAGMDAYGPKTSGPPLYGSQPAHEIHSQPEAYHGRHELSGTGYQ